MATSTASVPVPATTRRWRVVDIVVASVLGVASGVVFWAWGLLSDPLGVALGVLPGLVGLINGGWLFAGVLGGLVVRKPGAAFYTEVVAAVVSMVIGTQWGWLTLLSGVTQGLGVELVLVVLLYRHWRPWAAVLAGMGGAVGLIATDLTVWYPAMDGLFKVVYAVCSLISGAVLAGVLSWLAVRGLARAGALSRFAAGRETA